ncbi:phosphatase [Pasteurellaceae bacterium Pebbles2]|nr:phosphatase [Pasteurellaceae bacterium Pebbles2]
MKIYDLHSHSTASDGVLTPTQLIERAAEKNVNVLALTDHDSISGLSEAKSAAEKHQIQLINGVEISTMWENRGIHIVGLNFDETSPKLTALLAQQAELRHQRAKEIGEKLAALGIENAFDGAKALASGEVTRAHYARYLVQIGKVSNDGQAFKRYLSAGKPAYVKSDWVSIPQAIDVIHQAGGLAVLAHPLRYTMTNRWIKRLIGEFKQWGGDGLEIAGCGQTPDQRQLLARWATEYQLLGSLGSDFHFPCAWIELGKSLHITENITPIWTSWE